MLHELLCIVSRPSSISAKISLPSFSSFTGMGKHSPATTPAPPTHVGMTRLEQDLCRDQPSGHPTILTTTAVLRATPTSVPVPPGKKQEPNPLFLPAVRLCPTLGARSQPRPAEKQQEVEEKNRRGRVRGCQPSPRLPFVPALRCPCGGEANGSSAFSGLSRSPGACCQSGGRQRKFRSCFLPPLPQRLFPRGSVASLEQT